MYIFFKDITSNSEYVDGTQNDVERIFIDLLHGDIIPAFYWTDSRYPHKFVVGTPQVSP